MNIEFGTHTLKGYISFNSRKKKRVAGIETPSGFSNQRGQSNRETIWKAVIEKSLFLQ